MLVVVIVSWWEIERREYSLRYDGQIILGFALCGVLRYECGRPDRVLRDRQLNGKYAVCRDAAMGRM